MTVGFEIELFSALSCYSLKGETCVGTLINRTTPSKEYLELKSKK